MSKSRIVSLCVLILVVVAIGAYFVFFNQTKKELVQNPEELLDFNNYDKDLSTEMLDKYFKDFSSAKEKILTETATFNTSAWLTVARIKKYVKDYTGAEKIYLHVINYDNSNYVPEGNLADLYGNYINDWSKAAEHYWAAINKVGDNEQMVVSFYRNLADIYAFKLKDKANEFETQAEEMLKGKMANNVDFMTILAKYYKDSGNKERAIILLQKALTYNPSNAEAIRQQIQDLK